MFAAADAVAIDEMLVDRDVALGKDKEVNWESWLDKDIRESEQTDAVLEVVDLKELIELKYDSASSGELRADP